MKMKSRHELLKSLKKERKHLEKKILSLSIALGNLDFVSRISTEYHKLLEDQCTAMNDYADILSTRIALVESEGHAK